MLISRRRLYWGSVLCLAACICVLVRPMRSWIDQALVASMLCPGLEVEEVRFHASDSVIETRGLAWTQATARRQFGIRAPKTWFAIDPVALVDRRWDVATVVADDATIFLTDTRATPPQTQSIWQQELAKRVANLDWHDLREHFTSLLSAEGIAQRWDTRITEWLAKSETIVAESQQIAEEAASRDNPLRLEGAVRERLTQIEQLRSEQQSLMQQFDGVRKLLTAESSRLEELFAVDLQWLEQKAADQTDAVTASQESQRIAASLLSDIGQLTWKEYAPFAEIAARLAEGPPSIAFTAQGKNYRELSDPVVALNNLQASGNFLFQDQTTPFTLTGFYHQRAEPQELKDFHWNYTFHREGSNVCVDLTSLTPGLRKLTLFCSESDLEGTQKNTFSADLLIDQGELSGLISVLSANTARLDHDDHLQTLSEAIGTRAEDTSLDFKVHGTWTQPTIESISTKPDWLIDAVERTLDAPTERALHTARARLDQEFHTQLTRIQSLAENVTTEGYRITHAHQAKLVATRSRLQSSLNQMTNTDIRNRTTRPIQR